MGKKIELNTGEKTEIIFYFTGEEPEDIENPKFEELFNKCDILFIELNNREKTDEWQRKLRKVSKGKFHPTETPGLEKQVLFYPGFKEQVKYLYNSGKEVFLERSPLSASERIQDFQLYKKCLEKRETWEKAAKLIAYHQRCRDLKLVEDLKSLIKEKPGKTILITRGACHLFAWYAATKEGLEPKFLFSRDHYEIDSLDRLIMRYMFKKEYGAVEKLIEARFVHSL